MKKHILFFTMILVLSSCEKLQVQDKLPILTILEATDVTQSTVQLYGEITESEIAIDTKGFCWSENSMPTLNSSKIESIADDTHFTDRITDLKTDTEYYFRAYATTVQGTAYSEELIIKTLPISTPPCDIEENTLDRGSYQINYDNANISAENGQYVISTSAFNTIIEIHFKQMPQTREYKTIFWAEIEDTDACSVRGLFPFGSNSALWYNASDDHIIYIEKLENGRYKTEFCELKMYSEGYENEFTCDGHFITK